jgi:hypothetical protein
MKKPVKNFAARIHKLCKRCKAGYDPSRAVVFGTAMWLHDNVNACLAAEVHEERWQERQKKAA